MFNGSKKPNDSGLEKDVEVIVDQSGNVLFLYDDDVYGSLAGLLQPETVRASCVEMGGSGAWEVDVSPILQLYGEEVQEEILCRRMRREDALAQEAEWVRKFLRERDLPGT